MNRNLIPRTDLTIRIERRPVKHINIYLRAPYEEVLVTAPPRMAQSRIEAFILEKQDWILRNTDRLRAGYSAQPAAKELSEAQKRAYRTRLNQLLPKLLARWEPVLGVKAEETRLRVMKRCWGVCHCGARSITFNVWLGEKPEACVEYVVVHELCHLLEPSHNARFRGLMTRFLPDWQERRKKLNAPSPDGD